MIGLELGSKGGHFRPLPHSIRCAETQLQVVSRLQEACHPERTRRMRVQLIIR